MPTVELFIFFPFHPLVFVTMWGTALLFLAMWMYKFVVGLLTPFSGN